MVMLGRASWRGVVAFSVYGNNTDVNAGAVRQAELFYKWSQEGPVNWTLHYYVGGSVSQTLQDDLENLGARIFPVKGRPEDRTACFWRHHALLPTFDYYLFRNPTYRLGWREQMAVHDFVNSGAEFHFMRDHPAHSAPILPGLWGCSRRGRDRIVNRLPEVVPCDFFQHVNRWLGTALQSNDFPLVDKAWYWRHLWPHTRARALVHNEFASSRFHGRSRTVLFPTPRAPGEYVGQEFDADDQPLSEELQRQVDSLNWTISRFELKSHDTPPEKVCVKLACGLGNNIFQMVAGLALAQRLSDRSGRRYSCEILLPDPIDYSRSYAICETLGGHLRSDQHFRREHMDFGLPELTDLPSIFPNLLWRDLRFPRPLFPGDLTDVTSSQYFETSRYFDIQGDESYADSSRDGHFRVINCHFVPSFYPFPRHNWYPEALRFHKLFEPSPKIYHYIKCKYDLATDGNEALIGVHIRNDLRASDIHRSDHVPFDWYLNCVDAAVAAAGPETPILIVSNKVSANEASRDVHSELVKAITKSHPEHPLLISTEEPYYVDFFLLRRCSHLAISCSTFAFGAGITSPFLKTMFVPNTFSDRHFMDAQFPEFCAFLPDERIARRQR